MRPLALLAIALMPLAVPGCSEEAAEAPRWTEVVVPARQMLDLEYTLLSSGTPLAWQWQSNASVAFQVLYVEGASAYPFASEYGLAGEGERTTPREGRYDMTWDNRGDTGLTVRFIVRDGYTQRVWPPGQGPGCAPLLLGQVC